MGQDCFDIDYEGSRFLESTVVDGNIKSEKDICLEGVVRGNIHTPGRVVVDENAMVDGDVECGELYLKGEIKGNVCVARRTIMDGTALIGGGLVTESLQVFPGAKIARGLKLRKSK